MRRTEMRRHKGHLRDRSERELETHTLQQKETHTHTPETEKPGGRRGGEEIKESGRKRREGSR